MRTIVIAHQKGGVGKSTIAINLYHTLKDKMDVALQDFDNQGTTLRALGDATVYKKNDKIGEHQLLIIDTPPYLFNELPAILKNADMVIIPTRKSIPDLLAIGDTLDIIYQGKARNNNLKIFVLYNQVDTRTSLNEPIEEKIKSMGVEAFKTQINNRVNYSRSITSENGIYGLDTKAEKEFKELTNEILTKFI
ncbi:ParA family protein [Dysgonomonas sp. 521]|uniref:ParA family protein n=1 Tax=Dysgonomonas sp. 521 TaxID=2302932 RepID=UPI0013CF7B75|nr:ParA family protein [Dysgonomonas sp. 521]NDV96104.1 ParA family protein [Dysgonomonas sp. 521]